MTLYRTEVLGHPDTLSESTTGVADPTFLGPPGQSYFEPGESQVTCDFGTSDIVNGIGPDFNVYELSAGGALEFETIDVLVSEDGANGTTGLIWMPSVQSISLTLYSTYSTRFLMRS